MPNRKRAVVQDDITRQITVEYVPLDVVLKWPGNPKEHDIGAIAASIVKHGFRDPVAVNRRTLQIEEGHGRVETLAAMKAQGQPAPEFVCLDGDQWLIPVLFFDDDDLTAHSYALAHNRTQDLGGGYDDEKLLSALREQSVHGQLIGIGFDGDDLMRLQRKLHQETVDTSHVATHVFRYQVIVECQGESQQVELLERFQTEGLSCRALIT